MINLLKPRRRTMTYRFPTTPEETVTSLSYAASTHIRRFTLTGSTACHAADTIARVAYGLHPVSSHPSVWEELGLETRKFGMYRPLQPEYLLHQARQLEAADTVYLTVAFIDSYARDTSDLKKIVPRSIPQRRIYLTFHTDPSTSLRISSTSAYDLLRVGSTVSSHMVHPLYLSTDNEKDGEYELFAEGAEFIEMDDVMDIEDSSLQALNEVLLTAPFSFPPKSTYCPPSESLWTEPGTDPLHWDGVAVWACIPQWYDQATRHIPTYRYPEVDKKLCFEPRDTQSTGTTPAPAASTAPVAPDLRPFDPGEQGELF